MSDVPVNAAKEPLDGAFNETDAAADGNPATDGPAPAAKAALPDIPVPETLVITCQADLDQALVAHKGWIAGVLSPDVAVASGRANLSGVDLRGLLLSGANLSGANLQGANLQGVDLSGANLTVANLQRASLACADLRGARLTRAKFDGADLRGADLTGAVLTGVDLTKALLRTPDAAEPAVRAGASGTGPLGAVPPSADGIQAEPATAVPPPASAAAPGEQATDTILGM